MIDAYCDFIDTNKFFNKKKVYECSYCGMKLGLEDPNRKMLCPKKMQDYTISINKIINPQIKNDIVELKQGDVLQDIVLGKVIERSNELEKEINIDKSDKNMCSKEQIEDRMSICQTCEFFKDNSCTLCGCKIVREANHMNKLAHKDQKCPADKWGPVL